MVIRVARPLRLEFPGALYHVTIRSDRSEDVYSADTDREMFLRVFGDVCDRFDWLAHASCLMGNHCHLLVETPDANPSKGMRHLNGVHTQSINRAHRRVGHVFQGRHKAIVVQREPICRSWRATSCSTRCAPGMPGHALTATAPSPTRAADTR